jgi:hypothetical protein
VVLLASASSATIGDDTSLDALRFASSVSTERCGRKRFRDGVRRPCGPKVVDGVAAGAAGGVAVDTDVAATATAVGFTTPGGDTVSVTGDASCECVACAGLASGEGGNDCAGVPPMGVVGRNDVSSGCLACVLVLADL